MGVLNHSYLGEEKVILQILLYKKHMIIWIVLLEGFDCSGGDRIIESLIIVIRGIGYEVDLISLGTVLRYGLVFVLGVIGKKVSIFQHVEKIIKRNLKRVKEELNIIINQHKL